MATYKNIFPIYTVNTGAPQVEATEDDSFMGSSFKKALAYEYLKPAYQYLIMGALDIVQNFASAFDQTNEDGAYTLLEH